MMDARLRPGDNLFTTSVVSWDPDTGKMNWYFQYTPGDMWDFDEVGTHILIDRTVNGQPRKLVTHSARNGFVYTMERNNGAMVGAKPYIDVNWTKGIDQKTGKPIDSGALATAGGLVFVALMDGTIAAFDDTSLNQLWKINVGAGFGAPPMTFEVNGKQYIAIASGPSATSRTKLLATPELNDQRSATVLYVFSL